MFCIQTYCDPSFMVVLFKFGSQLNCVTKEKDPFVPVQPVPKTPLLKSFISAEDPTIPLAVIVELSPRQIVVELASKSIVQPVDAISNKDTFAIQPEVVFDCTLIKLKVKDPLLFEAQNLPGFNSAKKPLAARCPDLFGVTPVLKLAE